MKEENNYDDNKRRIKKAAYEYMLDIRWQEPTATCSYDYGNEFAYIAACEYKAQIAREIEGLSVEELRIKYDNWMDILNDHGLELEI